MTIIVEQEGYYIELEAKVLHPGYAGCYSGPWGTSYEGEGPELEFTAAWIVSGHNRYRKVDVNQIVAALDRREPRWLEFADKI